MQKQHTGRVGFVTLSYLVKNRASVQGRLQNVTAFPKYKGILPHYRQKEKAVSSRLLPGKQISLVSFGIFRCILITNSFYSTGGAHMKSIQTIDQYIAQYSEPIRSILTNVRTAVRNAAPTASEKIAYGIPTFFLHKNLVHFAAAKSHLGFYPTPSGIDTFRDELTEYHVSRGAIQFPYAKPLPYTLISEITAFRVAEIQKQLS